jgi:predicted nucleic acid-binding protein
MTAVADTSAIILLAKVGRLALLQELYGEVHVPPAVAAGDQTERGLRVTRKGLL